MTPAQKRGLVVGQQYRVKDDAARAEFSGRIVTFVQDDGDNNPWFRVDGESRNRAIQVSDIKDLDPSNGAVAFEEKEEVITTTTTTIIVKRKLTDAEKRQIQTIIGAA